MRLVTYNGTAVPGLSDLVRTAVRLHPRPGDPGPDESHFGGPLLWPADEPWPGCPITWPPEPEASDDAWAAGHQLDQPIPAMVSAAQFFRDDFPELPFPEGTDLLQVLFCPTEHTSRHYWGPAIRLVWRDSTQITEIADPLPTPDGAQAGYLPAPCVFEPCMTEELPRVRELPDDVRTAMGLGEADVDDFEGWPSIEQYSKIGGWTAWDASSPQELGCGDCGALMRQTLAFATEEHDGACGCEIPADEPAGWTLGRQGVLNVFTCPEDVAHPFKVRID